MRTITTLMTLLLAMVSVPAQSVTNETPVCDCPDCRENVEGKSGFSLPGLDRLEISPSATEPAALSEDEHAEHDPAETDPCCDVHEEASASGHVPDASEEPDHAEHADAVSPDGIQVRTAVGGTIARSVVFPAEIKLNRDRSAVVSPRYASVVRQVFAEIGDPVKKGDVLASLENRETMAAYTVAAPLDGVIIAKELSVGETADADRMIYEVADLSTVWADISIFPKYRHLLDKDRAVTFIAHDGHAAEGSIRYISPIVSHETRTFTARCVLKGADEDFTPGAFVRAELVVETADVPVAVPRAAVQRMDGESVVFVRDKHGFEPVPVELGLSDRHNAEIRRGLNPGDVYAAEGAFVLKARMVTSGMDPHAGHGH